MKLLPLSVLIAVALLATGCEPVDEDGIDSNEYDPAVVDNRGVDVDETTPPEPDNTGINERDAGGETITPDDQSNRQADVELVAEIRSKVMEIEDLSINGQNVKIIANGDQVILRGPVASAAERDAIVKVAGDIVGADNVIDELEVDIDR